MSNCLGVLSLGMTQAGLSQQQLNIIVLIERPKGLVHTIMFIKGGKKGSLSHELDVHHCSDQHGYYYQWSRKQLCFGGAIQGLSLVMDWGDCCCLSMGN